MKPTTIALVTASLLAAFPASSSATDVGPINALASELSARYDDENYGRDPRLGRLVLLAAVMQFMDGDLVEFDDGTSPAFVRALPGYLKRLYPEEFRKNTPDDVSDLVDAYVPAAADAWRDCIEKRCVDLEALIARADLCGYHVKASCTAKLRSIVSGARRAAARADAIASPRPRFQKLLSIRPLTAWEAVRRKLAASDPSEVLSIEARVAGRRLSGYEATEGSSSLVDGRLTLSAEFGFTRYRDVSTYDYWSYDLELTADGVVGAGKHAVAAATVGASHLVCDFDTEDCADVSGASFELVSGTVVVTELCDDRALGTFVVRLRDPTTGASLTIDAGRFELPLR